MQQLESMIRMVRVVAIVLLLVSSGCDSASSGDAPASDVTVRLYPVTERLDGDLEGYYVDLATGERATEFPPLWTADIFVDGYARAHTEEGFGLLDNSGNWVLAPRFSHLGRPRAGRMIAAEDGKYGIVDVQGDWILEPTYDGLGTLGASREMIAARLRPPGQGRSIQQWGYINWSGEVVVPVEHAATYWWGDGRGAVAVETQGQRRWGYVDDAGEWAIPPQYEQARGFSEGVAAVYHNGQWGYIDREGNWQITPRFAGVGLFHDGRAFVQQGAAGRRDPSILIDKQGERVSTSTFSRWKSFSQGLAAVKVAGQEAWTYIDVDGEPAFDGTFEEAGDFHGGVAAVQTENGIGLIDRAGEWLWRRQTEAELLLP